MQYIKRMLLLVLSVVMQSNQLYAANYVYLKNSLMKTSLIAPATGRQFTIGPASILDASLKKNIDHMPSYDDYFSTIKPGYITWAASTPSLTDGCTDTATCQMWELTFDIVPQNSQELSVNKAQMQPILLAPADDIELVYTKPTAENANVYYGYIVYTGGDRFESENNTNSGYPSPIVPILHADGITKFPVYQEVTHGPLEPPATQILANTAKV